MMNSKGNMIFYIVATIIMSFIFIMVVITDGEEAKEYVGELIAIIISMILAIIGYKENSKAAKNGEPKQCDKTYDEILDRILREDKKSYRKLVRVIRHAKHKRFRKAHRLLQDLEKTCVCVKDYVAVFTFKALVYSIEKNDEKAMECYKEVLKYDISNANALVRLGLYYKDMGRMEEAYESYETALRYNPQDVYALNNMACYLVYVNKPEEALPYALKAIELNKEVYQAMGAASVAYKMLGDEENANMYYEMYGIRGGKRLQLKKRLDEIENGRGI